MCVAVAATRPERVDRLAIYAGFVDGAGLGDPAVFDEVAAWVTREWGTGAVLGTFVESDDDQLEGLARLERNACTPQLAVAVLESNREIDVSPLLDSVRAPTLVLHNIGDPLIPIELGRAIASGIPHATLIEAAGTFHCTNRADDARDRVTETLRFLLDGDAPTPLSTRRLATVMITDIASSTDLAERRGDDQWARLLDRHDRVSSAIVEKRGGRVVKHTGDGTLAEFREPSPAIRAAFEVRDQLAELGLDVRTGLHTGEVEARGEDIGGIGVHLCARVAAAARPGSVAMTRTVRDLTLGSGLAFDDLGDHTLKGISETWQLFDVAGG